MRQRNNMSLAIFFARTLRPLVFRGYRELIFALCVYLLHYGAFHGSRLIQNALKQATDRGVRQRTWVRSDGGVQNLIFPSGLVERLAADVLDSANLHDALRAFV